jgi:hypothetical protein
VAVPAGNPRSGKVSIKHEGKKISAAMLGERDSKPSRGGVALLEMPIVPQNEAIAKTAGSFSLEGNIHNLYKYCDF